MKRTWLVLGGAFALVACGKIRQRLLQHGQWSGAWRRGDVRRQDLLSLSSGASGTYEVSGDTVILSGMSLTGSYKIEGNKLVGDRFTFVPRDPNDKSPIDQGPRGGSFDHETGVKSTLDQTKN